MLVSWHLAKPHVYASGSVLWLFRCALSFVAVVASTGHVLLSTVNWGFFTPTWCGSLISVVSPALAASAKCSGIWPNVWEAGRSPAASSQWRCHLRMNDTTSPPSQSGCWNVVSQPFPLSFTLLCFLLVNPWKVFFSLATLASSVCFIV